MLPAYIAILEKKPSKKQSEEGYPPLEDEKQDITTETTEGVDGEVNSEII